MPFTPKPVCCSSLRPQCFGPSTAGTFPALLQPDQGSECCYCEPRGCCSAGKGPSSQLLRKAAVMLWADIPGMSQWCRAPALPPRALPHRSLSALWAVRGAGSPRLCFAVDVLHPPPSTTNPVGFAQKVSIYCWKRGPKGAKNPLESPPHQPSSSAVILPLCFAMAERFPRVLGGV